MGQKVNPNIFRVGPKIGRKPNSNFYAKSGKYGNFLREDILVKKAINDKCVDALVSSIYLERTTDSLVVVIYARKVGVIIGKDGSGIGKLKNDLQKFTPLNLSINVQDVKNQFIDAPSIASQITMQLKKRVSHKRAMKMAADNSMKNGAKGIKIVCSGRLGGAEIAKSEFVKKGRVPLHTLRANIFYSFREALTPYGIIGVKVWIYLGELAIIKKV